MFSWVVVLHHRLSYSADIVAGAHWQHYYCSSSPTVACPMLACPVWPCLCLFIAPPLCLAVNPFPCTLKVIRSSKVLTCCCQLKRVIVVHKVWKTQQSQPSRGLLSWISACNSGGPSLSADANTRWPRWHCRYGRGDGCGQEGLPTASFRAALCAWCCYWCRGLEVDSEASMGASGLGPARRLPSRISSLL